MRGLIEMFRDLRHKPDPTAARATVVAASRDELPPAPTLDTKTGECDSALERLPAEVRRHILSLSDLHGLKALVLASPTFHQQYLLDRRYLLTAGLEVTLGSVSLDAHTILKVKTHNRLKVKTYRLSIPQYLTGLLETWQRQLPHKQSYRLTGVITDDEVIDMVAFYFRNVAPIARHFIEGTQKELERQFEVGEASPQLEPQPGLSNIEWQRCLRATYRFELLCCLTHPYLQPPSHDVVTSIATCLFYAPEPWEGEELFCIYQFAQTVYQSVFDDIKDELHPDNPRFDDQDRPPTPIGAFELHNTWNVQNYVEGTALRGGLDLLRVVLIDLVNPHDREALVTAMQRSIVSSFIPIDPLGALSDMTQEDRRQAAPSPWDELTAERSPLPFRGDSLGGPPRAWTVIWGGSYSNLIGDYIPDEMRRWGYVFWDVNRLERPLVMDVLKRQWEDRWDEDPRVYI